MIKAEITEWADVDPEKEDVGIAYGVRLSEGNGFHHYAEDGQIWITEDLDKAERKRKEVRNKVKGGADYKSLSVRGYKKMNAMVFEEEDRRTPEEFGCDC